MNLRERWVEAMSRIACSLISNTFTEEQAIIVCRGYKNIKVRPTLARVEKLERELDKLPPIPEKIRAILESDLTSEDELEVTIEPQLSRPTQAKQKTRIQSSDWPGSTKEIKYPHPWCRVTKDGVLVRWEDAYGHTIPKDLWPKE